MIALKVNAVIKKDQKNKNWKKLIGLLFMSEIGALVKISKRIS